MEITIKRINEYKACPYKYYLRYIKGLTNIGVQPSRFVEFCVMKAIFHMMSRKQLGSTLDISSVCNDFYKHWNKNIDKVLFPKSKSSDKYLKNGEIYIRDLFYMMDSLFKMNSRDTSENITAINQPYLFSIDGHSIAGNIDIITADTNGEPVLLFIDFSRTKRDENEYMCDLKYAASIYGFRELYKKKESRITIYHIGTKEYTKIFNSEKYFNRMKEELSMITKAISQNIFYPSQDHMCSVCGVKGSCFNNRKLI